MYYILSIIKKKSITWSPQYTDAQKKAFDKTHFFTIKNTQQTRNKKELTQSDKRTFTKTPQLITY